jgi:hypothetical protein
MKKLIAIIILGLLSIIICISKDEKQIRLRIISSSDDKDDIMLKEEVKNAVTYYLKEIYVEDYQTYVNNINNSLVDLENIIDRNYIDCNVEFNYHTLYNKENNGMPIKNESILTLVITLGKGEGNNWWGTIYPEYLGMESCSVVKYESLFANLINYIKRKDDK